MGAVYEFVVLFGVVVFFAYGFSAVLQYRAEAGPLRWAFQAFLFLVLAAYFVWFWSEGRRTLPMKTVSLLLVDRDGDPLTASRAAARYLWAAAMLAAPLAAASAGGAVFLLLLPLPFAWALFDREHRALYDVLAGTRLVVDEPAPAGTPAARIGQERTQSTK